MTWTLWKCDRCLENIPDDEDSVQMRITVENRNADLTLHTGCFDQILEDIISKIDSTAKQSLEKLRV